MKHGFFRCLSTARAEAEIFLSLPSAQNRFTQVVLKFALISSCSLQLVRYKLTWAPEDFKK